MAQAGFEYHNDAAFPDTALLAVADGLDVPYTRDVQPGPDAMLTPADRNSGVVAGMGAADKDRYFRTLLAESAGDIEASERSGLLPPGRSSNFATGGCVGKAEAGFSSVWAVPRQLESAIEAMRQAIPRSPQVRKSYRTCTKRVAGVAEDTPGDLEERAMLAGPNSAFYRAFNECASTWANEYGKVRRSLAEAFEATHRASLEKQLAGYEGIMLRIDGDAGFKAHLRERAAQVAAELADDHVAP